MGGVAIQAGFCIVVIEVNAPVGLNRRPMALAPSPVVVNSSTPRCPASDGHRAGTVETYFDMAWMVNRSVNCTRFLSSRTVISSATGFSSEFAIAKPVVYPLVLS